MNKNEKLKLEHLRNNTAFWVENCCKIFDKDLNLVNFIPNNQQRELLEVMEKQKFILVCKQRQNGISSIVAVKALHICLTVPNSSCLLMSYSIKGVKDLWKKLKDIYGTIPKFLSVPLVTRNKDELVFANGSRIVCCVCGTRDVAHGATLSYIHLSEAAKCRDSLPNQIASLQAALVPSGIFCIESTPQEGLTQFAEMFQSAMVDRSSWYPVFFSWTDDIGANGMHATQQKEWAELYVDIHGRLPIFEELDEEEKALYYKGCGFNILAWRRIGINKYGGKQKFNENFPVDADTAFLSNITDSMFETYKIQERLNEIRDLKPIPIPDDLPVELKSWYGNGLDIWAKPEPNKKYFLGVDTAEGLNTKNADYSVIEVMDETGFQCAEVRTKRTKPFRFANVVNQLGKYYNDGLLIIEKQSAGIAVLSKLTDDYEYYNIYRSREPDSRGFNRRKDGFSTTEKSKKKLVQDYIEWFEEDDLILNSKVLLTEMLAFCFKNGSMGASTGHDDTVLAMGMCIQGFKSDIYYC